MAKKIEVKEVKTVKLSIDTWKALSQKKLDDGVMTMEEVIKEMLRDAGY